MNSGVILKKFRRKFYRISTWLLPGMQVKRWVVLNFVGTLLAVIGIAILLELQPVAISIHLIKNLATIFPSWVNGVLAIGIGLIFFILGFKNANSSIMDAIDPSDRSHVLETLYKRRKLNKGPKIVAIGGGTGLSTILRGLKRLTNNITAVVTVGDDGGSSGRLREEMGILPPGDIRNCIAALANDDDLVTKLFKYRFKTGYGLEGHSFGNLFLSVLCEITGDMVNAVKESSKVLAIRGRVLPSTLDDVRLIAEMEDGRVIVGESNIPEAEGKIDKLRTEPENPRALDDVIKAINEADLIIMGPGSLFTSIIPNLLVDEISEAVSKSLAKKVYVCNIMTQPGETDDFTVSDHVKKILEHSKFKNIIDTVFVNDSLPKDVLSRYKAGNQIPVKLDTEKLKELGVNAISSRLIEEDKDGFVRHNYNKLANNIHKWYKANAEKSESEEVSESI